MDRHSFNLIYLIQNRTIFKPICREELKNAVELLDSNQKYGHISYWNVEKVTDMSKLFKYVKRFN